MKKTMITVVFALLLIFSVSCGDKNESKNDDSNTNDENVQNDDDSLIEGKYKIEGFVQKGPFVQGSEITIAEIDSELVPIGTSYTTSTVDDFGSFEISKEMSTNYVEVTASGYYFNEVEGKLSTSELNFRVVSDLTEEKPVNINILTTIERERIKVLIGEGKTFEEARTQAETEILAVFNIKGFEKANFQEMDISKEGDSNAILLAISAVLQNGSTEAELSELISKITQDLKDDGILNGQTQKDMIRGKSMSLDLAAVRTNLEKRYSDLGLTLTIPKFEDFVDSDGDGIINRYDFTIEFETVDNADLLTEYTSNEVEIVLPPDAEKADATVDRGIIVVNGEDTGTAVNVKNGDKVAVKLLSSDKHGEAVTTELSVKYLEIQEVKGSFTVTAKTGKYFSLDFEPVTDGDLDTEYTSKEIEITLPAGVAETQLSVDKGSIIINGSDKGKAATAVNGDKIAIKAKSSKTKYGEPEIIAVTAIYLDKNEVKGSFSITAPNVKCGDVVCVDRVYDLEWQKEPSESYMKWSAAVSYCENLNYDSKTDWRLPNINELRSLIVNCPVNEFGGECGISDPKNLIISSVECKCGNTGGPFSAINNETTSENYFGMMWSNSTKSDETGFAWVIQYSDGSVGFVEKETTDTYVFTRCVRGEELLEEGEDPPSQIYRDPDTNFEWMKNAVQNDNPLSPETYCNDLVLEGKDDWHLPTISELRTIVKDDPVLKTGGTCHITDQCSAIDDCGTTPECQTNYGGQNVCVFDTANFSFINTELPNTISSTVYDDGRRFVISFCKSPKGITAQNNPTGMIRCVRN